MKIIKDKHGYVTSIIILLLLIPVMLLLMYIIDENNDINNKTIENIESNKITSIEKEFNTNIDKITKKCMHNAILTTIQNKKTLNNSRLIIKAIIQKEVNKTTKKYNKEGYNIECNISSLKSATDPFKVTVTYTLIINSKNNKSKINKTVSKDVELTDSKYPIYDPLPTLKTGTNITNTTINYTNNLIKNIKYGLPNRNAYNNAISGCIIKKCPYENYESHGHNNTIISNCLDNHYYHKSRDGLCIFCRLENRSSCKDMGFETFIIPTMIVDEAPVSIDHVLLNGTYIGQYSGNKIKINNTTVLYLDNGHKTKYGL